MSKNRSIIEYFLIATAVLMVAFIVFGFVDTMDNLIKFNTWEMHENMSDEEKERYCNMVLAPELKDYCMRCGIKPELKTVDGKITRVCIECTSCDALPEKYREAAEKALKTDKGFSSRDLNDQNVEVYTIEDGLPLTDVNDLPEEYRELAKRVTKNFFQVLVYDSEHRVFMFWFEYR